MLRHYGVAGAHSMYNVILDIAIITANVVLPVGNPDTKICTAQACATLRILMTDALRTDYALRTYVVCASTVLCFLQVKYGR